MMSDYSNDREISLDYIQKITSGVKAIVNGKPQSSEIYLREFTKELGSGAIQTVIIAHRMPSSSEGKNIKSALGRIGVRIDTDRPFRESSRLGKVQFAELDITLMGDQRIVIDVDGTGPFDNKMEHETSEAWQKWGINLIYEYGSEDKDYSLNVFTMGTQSIYTAIRASLSDVYCESSRLNLQI
jgi:hypothetical protein